MVVRLGLIGDNIAASQAPRLHRLAGTLSGLEVSYELLIPSQLGMPFDALVDSCRRDGFRGLNITYPYKEKVLARIEEPDRPAVGASNTIVFEETRTLAFNTDCSGFVAAYRHSFGSVPPGIVAMAGAGGVGRAMAFGLAELGARELRLHDQDRNKAESIAKALEGSAMQVSVAPRIEDAAAGADGLLNATPLGMVGIGGTAFPTSSIAGARWAFDAVYTPVLTPFLADARAAGLEIMSGYELFFFQGVDAFRIFTGIDPDQNELRAALASPNEDARRSA